MNNTLKTSLKLATGVAAILMLSGCGSTLDRLSRVGQAPPMTNIENPYNQPGYRPITMPMPPQEAQNTQMNSLWQAGRQTFFKDQRAHKVGDIMTILIDISDSADLKNKTERSRDGTEDAGLPNFLGAEAHLGQVLAEEVDPEHLIGMTSSSASNGDGKVERGEDIKLKLAATVMQVLPNGNFVIQGRQQVRVNFELRDLTLQGVIRPEDILNNNSISYEKIAEARISYGGKGNITDLQQARYGQQLIDILSPF